MKQFFQYALIILLGIVVFVAGATAAGSGSTFGTVIGVFTMAEALVLTGLTLREISKRK